MSAFGKRRVREDPDVEINMVPIMNMFLVLIPFLLMSASFLHLKAIDTSVPVRAATSEQQEEDKKSDIVVTATIKLDYDGIFLSIASGELTESQLAQYDTHIQWNKEDSETMEKQVAAALKNIKSKYPKSNTLILSPTEDVIYKDIVSLMDTARKHENEPLFPVVVISGEVKPS